jgi:fido (protein-threonine AMPylation protein)
VSLADSETRWHGLYMAKSSTELQLSMWRSGATQAERLAAALLRIEGYADVEPQAPLGGPDGRADILCFRGDYAFVAAVYFPPTLQSFSDVFDKFDHDLAGATSRSRNAFAFFTNQRLTLGERGSLKQRALEKNLECEIYDVERIAGALDEPAGYGLRAAYLGLPMADAEQISYFARREHLSETALNRNTAELRRVAEMMARLELHGRAIANTVRTIAQTISLPGELPPLRLIDPLSVGELSAEPGVQRASWSLSPELILMTHRLVCFELPSRLIGRFRTEAVSVAPPGGTLRALLPADQIPRAIPALCAEWASQIVSATDGTSQLNAIARFHNSFLAIHPFLDGNGRTARAILLQQCVDTFGRVDMSRLDRGVAYQAAIEAADAGDMVPLVDVIAPIVAT